MILVDYMAYVIPLIAYGLYSGVLTGIEKIIVGTCSAVRNIYTHKNPEITAVIKQLDLERRLLLVRSVLGVMDRGVDVPSTPTLRACETLDVINKEHDPIELCLLFVKHTVHDIHDDLSLLNAKIERHKSKWFSDWRYLNIKNLLESLENHSKQLDARFNDLTKISTFLSILAEKN